MRLRFRFFFDTQNKNKMRALCGEILLLVQLLFDTRERENEMYTFVHCTASKYTETER